jgi:hypothetical protein
MRVVWLLQIVIAGIQELESDERRLARDIAQRVYRDRHLSPRDRQHLLKLAQKAGRGARRRAMPRGARGRS